MSVAERTAYQVYEKYHLGALPNDVKDQIIILMLKNRNENASYRESLEDDSADGMVAEEMPARLSLDELHSRIDLAKSQIESGMARPIDEFFDEMDSKYPELCK